MHPGGSGAEAGCERRASTRCESGGFDEIEHTEGQVAAVTSSLTWKSW